MKYCQKCKVMLKDETEVCPICGYEQKPAEEVEAAERKKKKTVKALLIAVCAVLAAALIFIAVCMILGKEAETVSTDETYSTVVADTDIQTQFAAYVATAMPEVWEETEEERNYAVEYYNTNDLPELAQGFVQAGQLQPVVGALESVGFGDVVTSEAGEYRMRGVLTCEKGKVNYTLLVDSSGLPCGLSFELKEETFPQKVRYFLTEKVF